MIRWVIGSSLKLPFIVIALAAAMMYFGLAQLRDMPVDVFPEFAPPRVELQTEAPGLSTVETEEILTIPLEQSLAGTPGLDVLRSKTVPGLSSIELIFKPGTDIWLARQLVQERLNTVDLPTAVGVPIMLPPLSSTSRALSYLTLATSNADAFSPSQADITFQVSDTAVELRVSAEAASGQAILSATGEIYYCREGEEAVCLIDKVDLALPITVVAGGATVAIIDYELPQ